MYLIKWPVSVMFSPTFSMEKRLSRGLTAAEERGRIQLIFSEQVQSLKTATNRHCFNSTVKLNNIKLINVNVLMDAIISK